MDGVEFGLLLALSILLDRSGQGATLGKGAARCCRAVDEHSGPLASGSGAMYPRQSLSRSFNALARMAGLVFV
jgi:hypothetical protein